MDILPLVLMAGLILLVISVLVFMKFIVLPGRGNEAGEQACDLSPARLDRPDEDFLQPPPVPASTDPADIPARQQYQFVELDLPVLESEQIYLMEELALSLQASNIIRKSNHLIRMYHMMTHPLPAPSQPQVKKEIHMLSSIDADNLKAQIQRKLQDDQVYLIEDLTISAFAHELGIEPHQLSRFLNVHLNTTYTDLINSYRVHEAKSLLINKPEDSILDIAFSSGFNSKASFNRIFKKMAGMTPSEYRLKNKAGRARTQSAMGMELLPDS